MCSESFDPARRVPASASLLWTQRHNPPWLDVPTFVAAFRRRDGDAQAWDSTDGRWAAELRRAAHGQHVYLAVWHDGTLLGTYDGRRGWRPAGRGLLKRRASRQAARQLAFAS